VRSLRIVGYLIGAGLGLALVGLVVGAATGRGARAGGGWTLVGTGLFEVGLAVVGPLTLTSEAMGWYSSNADGPLAAPGGFLFSLILFVAGVVLLLLGASVLAAG
jgi:hypothetical protein